MALIIDWAQRCVSRARPPPARASALPPPPWPRFPPRRARVALDFFSPPPPPPPPPPTAPRRRCSYTTSLTEVFSRQHKLELEWRVELALLKALGEVGKIPAEAHGAIKRVIDSGAVTLARTLEIEKSTHHDIMAMVKAIAEQSPEFGGFVHYGATSQDVNDTVLALQMGECKVRRPAGGGRRAGARGRGGGAAPRYA